MSGLAMALASGGLVAGGAVATVMGTRRAAVRLDDAFARLDGAGQTVTETEEPTELSARVGQRVAETLRLPAFPGQDRLLALQGRTRAQHMGDKVVMAVVGLFLPTLLSAFWVLVFDANLWLPAIAAPVGLVVGFFVPDVLLTGASRRLRTHAGEALFTYFDLVTLERLANRSASQALSSAAEISSAPLFLRIFDALERARLEQRPPFAELHRLADELELPALADVADVMALDEVGASLSEALRARVRDLRDAHLTQAKVAAHAQSERMTIPMVLPAMILGLIFLTPPLLRLLG